ncbi:MAG: toxic anion resistance protein [Chloroflexi bacterium]|nr:toxic anion resistance protein [Chloroflexota bacterium]
MTGEQRNEHTEERMEVRPEGGPGQLQVVEPVVPRGMTGEQVAEARRQANALVTQLVIETGSSELEALDKVTNVGMQTQRGAADQLGFLKVRVADFLKDGGASKDIATGLGDLRRALDQLNPHSAATSSPWHRIFPHVPFFPAQLSPVRALQRIAMRYEPVSIHIASIESRLREGRGMLVRDNVELRKLYERVEAQQHVVQQAVYLGELLMFHLVRELKGVEDQAKRNRLQDALHDVTMRVQDLRTMEEVHFQYFVSIEMSRQNNNRLGQAVDRTMTLATNVITVGLAIQSAMVRQRSVMEATARTREFLGDIVTANAAAIKRHTEEIGELYTNPVIAVEKITQAHDDLLEALNAAAKLRAEAIENANQNIARLTQLSTEIQTKVLGVAAEVSQTAGALEAPRGDQPAAAEDDKLERR